MDNRNLYLTYKKDTSRLLYWVINTSNSIARSKVDTEACASVSINTTGRSTVSEIVHMSKFIADNLQPIPAAVLRLFQGVIKARSTIHATFQQFVSNKPDPEIERSNVTHKHFIDALTEAFEALGGVRWVTDTVPSAEQADLDQQYLRNAFSALSVSQVGDDDDASSADEPQVAQRKVRKKRTGKGKKGKRGNKGPLKTVPADIPVESYRIINDEDGMLSEYLLAVFAVVHEWVGLRSYTQDLWRDVAYEGLNSAVAASVTSAAVAMVHQTCIRVFAEFPGHESYETIMQTITRGDFEQVPTTFGIYHYLDAEEQFWIHAYNDLMAFVTDFRQNRTGKPTKAMQKQLNEWSPTYDLQKATSDERLKWRRAYTINWLYDLVNVYSCIVVVRNTLNVDGTKHVLEDVDWSPNGPWYQYRRLFGLNEFASFVTTLAMQKPGTDTRAKILPHHVFQLQCIVDSMASSRGWTVHPVRGHVLEPPAREFFPRRDLDLFYDRSPKRDGQDVRDVMMSIIKLEQYLERDADLHQQPDRHATHRKFLSDLNGEFAKWLGESEVHGLAATIPPSRFSKHHANGLWEYSPLLCGAGLVEGIVYVQRVMMFIWDDIPEPTLAMHMYNMLQQKGYLQCTIPLFAMLEVPLKEAFYPEGVPTSDFYQALGRRVAQRNGPAIRRQRQAVGRSKTADIHQLLAPELNNFFKTKSTLMMFYDTKFVPERIPDSDIRIPSDLCGLRLAQTERVLDPSSNEKRLEETELVKRAKSLGITDALLLAWASVVTMETTGIATAQKHVNAILKDAQENIPKLKGSSGPIRDPYRVSKEHRETQLQGHSMLRYLRKDTFADVCGERPFSGLNLVLITVFIMLLFEECEKRFEEARHPLWIDAYEQPSPRMRYQKRVALVGRAMALEDDSALKIFAEVFEKLTNEVHTFIFWDDLLEEDPGLRKQRDGGDGVYRERCWVM